MERRRLSNAEWLDNEGFAMEPLVSSSTSNDVIEDGTGAASDSCASHSAEKGNRHLSSSQSISRPIEEDDHNNHLEQHDKWCMARVKPRIRKTQQGFNYFIHQWWGWEVIGLLISVLCTTAVAVLLDHVHKQPLSDWPFDMEPNTLISIFTTLAKSSMLVAVTQAINQLKWEFFHSQPRKLHHLEAFNDASRGPWGALLFVYRTRGRALLASFGAFIVVAALAMDPFAQQILSFQSQAIDHHGDDTDVWIPFASAYLPDYNGTTDFEKMSCKLINQHVNFRSRLQALQ